MLNVWFIKCKTFQLKHSNVSYLHASIDHIDFHTKEQTFDKRFHNIVIVMKTVLSLTNKWHSNNNNLNRNFVILIYFFVFFSFSIGPET